MKRTLRFCSTILLLSLPAGIVSCSKPDDAASGARAGAEKGATAASNDPAAAGSVWGFASRLHSGTEAFAAFYRTADLVDAVRSSSFLKKLQSLPGAEQLGSMAAGPDAEEAMTLAREILGREVVLVLPEGFTDNASKIFKAVGPVLTNAFLAGARSGIKRAAEGDAAPVPSPVEAIMASLKPEDISRILTDLTEADVPPLLMAVKAGSVRTRIDGFIKQSLEAMPPDAKAIFESGTFQVNGSGSFQSLKITVSKALPPPAVEQMKAVLQQITGDAAKAEALTAKILTKTFEASWGWIDDHLVLSLGRDHSHVKFAGAGDGVFNLPEVSGRVAAWQAKRPFHLSFASQKTMQTVGGAFGGTADLLASILQMAAAQSPLPLDGLIADLKKIGARAAELWPNKSSALLVSAWWDGGVNIETFGGQKPDAYDSSKPLPFGNLIEPTTVLLSESRVNEASRDKTFAFVEEAAGMLWDSYQKNIKPSLPEQMKSQLLLAEGFGVGMVKSLWKSVQDFRRALGAESVFMVNLDGAMPDLPQIPAEVKDIKIPRVAMISEMKDRKLLGDAWRGVSGVIGLGVTAAKLPVKPDPIEKKEGDASLWGYQLPVDTGDLWPHTAVAGTQWMFATSPSLTKNLLAKKAAPAGPPAGAHLVVNFSAIWNYAESILKVAPVPADNTPAINAVLDLARSLQQVETRTGEDRGDSHSTMVIRIQDR